jgi:hypothetical protein
MADAVDSKSAAADKQPPIVKPVSETENVCLASCLAFLERESPDLAAVVAAWPTLPKRIKTIINALIGGDDEP